MRYSGRVGSWSDGLVGRLGRVCAFATEYYVAPTGSSDSNDGSIGSPFATFGKAIGSATAGDTIFARGGTYNLSTPRLDRRSKSGTAANPYQLSLIPAKRRFSIFAARAVQQQQWRMKGIEPERQTTGTSRV